MKRLFTIAWIGTICALLLGVAAGLILPHQSSVIKVSMIFSVAAVLLSLLAIPFFIIGMKNFKIELKHAYVILCIGIGVFGIAQIQLPIINIIEASIWVDSGGIAIPYLVGVICIFWSMRILSRLLAIKSAWRSISLAMLATVIISLGIALLPHVKVSSDELSYHIALALSIWNSVFITFAAVLAYKVRQKIGLSYTSAMTWLFWGLAVLSFAGWNYTLAQLITTSGYWYWDYSIPLLPFVAGSLILVIAGYTFDAINAVTHTESPKSVPTAQPLRRTTTILTPLQELDIVLYVANLVSNPTDIDIVLDDVRTITSRLQPGQAPTAEEQAKLDKVYKRLEEYLLHRDTLRVFTEDELRERIAKRFNLDGPIKTTLWPKQ
jgi:hypothetical protein